MLVNKMNPLEAAWYLLKGLPEQQMFLSPEDAVNLIQTRDYEPYPEYTSAHDFTPVGTVHPAIYGMLARKKLQEVYEAHKERRARQGFGTDFVRPPGPYAEEGFAPDLRVKEGTPSEDDDMAILNLPETSMPFSLRAIQQQIEDERYD